MLELILVRHASTALNEQRRYQGWTDPPLSERGRREARRLGERLGAVPFDALLHSGARRCAETAALAFPGRPATPDPRWRELDFGAWDGHSYEECQARDPELLRAWIDDPTRTTPPAGEPFERFRQRVDEAMAALPARGRALLIAHGGSIRRILAAALGLEWRQVVLMQLSACGMTRLALHPEGGHLLCLNDTAHLEGEGYGFSHESIGRAFPLSQNWERGPGGEGLPVRALVHEGPRESAPHRERRPSRESPAGRGEHP